MKWTDEPLQWDPSINFLWQAWSWACPPSPTWSGCPRTPSLCPPVWCAANTSSQLKRPWRVAGELIIYLCISWLFNMLFKGRRYFLLEKDNIDCGGRENDWHYPLCSYSFVIWTVTFLFSNKSTYLTFKTSTEAFYLYIKILIDDEC